MVNPDDGDGLARPVDDDGGGVESSRLRWRSGEVDCDGDVVGGGDDLTTVDSSVE